MRTRLDKRERIRLLLRTRTDALEETGRRVDGRGQFGSRTLQHGELWREGSYAELERQLDQLRILSRRVYWHTVSFYRSGVEWRPGLKPRIGHAELGVMWLSERMANVYVPASVSENAGFILSEAKGAARPRSRAV